MPVMIASVKIGRVGQGGWQGGGGDGKVRCQMRLNSPKCAGSQNPVFRHHLRAEKAVPWTIPHGAQKRQKEI